MFNKTNEDLICWMKINSRSYWKVALGDVAVGDFQVEISTDSAVVDSGASLSYIPTRDYDAIYAKVFDSSNNAQCSVSRGITYCDCSSVNDPRYKVISFKMGKRYTFFMESSDYLLYDN